MSQLSVYIRKTVGGSVRIPKLKMRPGHIVSFEYAGERPKRIPRLIFILNTTDARTGSRMVHGLNLENIPWSRFLPFLKKLLVTDTITLIKRKYEIRGPFNEILDKPKTFYTKLIKTSIPQFDVYRTYKLSQIKNVKMWALDYSSLMSKNNELQQLLIKKDDKVRDIIDSRDILNELFDIDSGRLKDHKYKQLVIQRFGSVERFQSTVAEINELTEDDLI